MSDTAQDAAHLTARSTLSPALKAWELFLSDQGRSQNTIKAFLADLRLLAEFLPADRTLGEITTAELNRYFDWMQKERGVPCSPKTLARRITATKSFFRWLHRHGVLSMDPAEKVLQRSVLSPLPVVLTEEEARAAQQAADAHRRGPQPDARYAALLGLLLATGIKKSECIGIHLNHLELDAPDGPQVFIRYASASNRYKERRLPLPEEWLQVYREYVEQYRPADRLFPWSPRRLEYLLEDISREAGLEKHISFDMCRWTSALFDLQAGMEPERIRQKLGVSKIQWREVSMKLRRLAGQED